MRVLLAIPLIFILAACSSGTARGGGSSQGGEQELVHVIGKVAFPIKDGSVWVRLKVIDPLDSPFTVESKQLIEQPRSTVQVGGQSMRMINNESTTSLFQLTLQNGRLVLIKHIGTAASQSAAIQRIRAAAGAGAKRS